ncbi:hypothetical protein N658DRAFT_218932 [Parathielavia hyrcaniae]|uniref:Uncharacterized protein n=1 Tax=Parathielavia hyrcaniae TaxID=113614 RepID=A0AAN6PVC3_9PEZI|nr:hypothetical protein N658DRAFT_218932 [Parathielavia hyrcaniae]
MNCRRASCIARRTAAQRLFFSCSLMFDQQPLRLTLTQRAAHLREFKSWKVPRAEGAGGRSGASACGPQNVDTCSLDLRAPIAQPYGGSGRDRAGEELTRSGHPCRSLHVASHSQNEWPRLTSSHLKILPFSNLRLVGVSQLHCLIPDVLRIVVGLVLALCNPSRLGESLPAASGQTKTSGNLA